MTLEDQGVTELLEELVAWTRFANRASIIQAWDSILAEDKHLLAYELSDGSRNQPQVAAGSGLSQPTVSSLWARWRRLGIARLQGKNVAHLARPSDLGMKRASDLVSAASKGSDLEASTHSKTAEGGAGG